MISCWKEKSDSDNSSINSACLPVSGLPSSTWLSWVSNPPILTTNILDFISSTFIIELFLGLPLFISVVALSLPLIAISYLINNFSIHFSFVSIFLFILSLFTFYFLYPEILITIRLEDYIYYLLVLICLNIGLRLDGKKQS